MKIKVLVQMQNHDRFAGPDFTANARLVSRETTSILNRDGMFHVKHAVIAGTPHRTRRAIVLRIGWLALHLTALQSKAAIRQTTESSYSMPCRAGLKPLTP